VVNFCILADYHNQCSASFSPILGKMGHVSAESELGMRLVEKRVKVMEVNAKTREKGDGDTSDVMLGKDGDDTGR